MTYLEARRLLEEARAAVSDLWPNAGPGLERKELMEAGVLLERGAQKLRKAEERAEQAS